MAKRHGTWTFTGERAADGRPLRFFHGIPARDLAPRDIDRLDDEQYATVEASDLYEKAEPAKSEPKKTAPKKRKASTKRTTTAISEKSEASPTDPATPTNLDAPTSDSATTDDLATSGKEG